MNPKIVKLCLIFLTGAAVVLALFPRQAAAQPVPVGRPSSTVRVRSLPPAQSIPNARLIFAETVPQSAVSTVWLASAADPSERVQIASIDHAVGYPPTGAVSPSGDRVAFFITPPGEGPASARSTGSEIWLAALDGSPALLLTSGSGFFGHWSPDGVWLTFGRLTPLDQPAGGHVYYRTEIYRISAQDGASNLILTNEQDYALYPLGWAPQGDRYLVAVADITGAWRVEARDPATGDLLQTWPLPPYSLPRRFSLSPDAQSLLVEDLQSGQAVLSIFDLTGQQAQSQSILSSAPISDQRPVSPAAALWLPTGRSLWVYRQQQPDSEAVSQVLPLEAAAQSAPSPALDLPPDTLLLPESISPDAQWRSWRLYPHNYTTAYVQPAADTTLTQITPLQPGSWITHLGWSLAPQEAPVE